MPNTDVTVHYLSMPDESCAFIRCSVPPQVGDILRTQRGEYEVVRRIHDDMHAQIAVGDGNTPLIIEVSPVLEYED